MNKINDNKDGYYPDNGDSNNAEETYHDFDENGAKVENTGFRKAVVPDFKGPTNERQVSTLLNLFFFVADADYRRAPKVPHWGRRCSDNSSTGHSSTDNWSTGLETNNSSPTTRRPNIVSLICQPCRPVVVVDHLSLASPVDQLSFDQFSVDECPVDELSPHRALDRLD